MTLLFEGEMAVLYFSAVAQTDRQGIVYGDKGTLVVENINNPETYMFTILIVKSGFISCAKQITGFEYEVDSVIKAIEQGRLECPEMPHSEIIRIMRLMDDFRNQCGVIYPLTLKVAEISYSEVIV